MDTVEVFLSTYNGSEYLAEQLDSLLAQKDVAVAINVRDDGSTDETVAILEHYSKLDNRVSYRKGVNLGFAQSFFDILKNCGKADFYAFCDQDDVWDNDKLSSAVKMMKQAKNDVPVMYYSNLRVVDKDLSFLRVAHSRPHIHINKYSALIENAATGCTIVINKSAADLIKDRLPRQCQLHDWWIYLVCVFLGNVVYDTIPHISYRQHGNNVIGTFKKRKSLGNYIKRFSRLFNRNLQPSRKNALGFLESYGDLVSDDDLIVISKLAFYKQSLLSRISLLVYPIIHATTMSREIRYRLLIILGLV